MRKIIILLIILTSLFIVTSLIFARENNTVREEAEGKEIWEKLQSKQVECKNLTNDNFESLGEYFMGQMAGGSHEAMNSMMERMMGKVGEEQMHSAMGKRLSGCDPNAPIPSNGIGFMPMMWIVKGGGNSMMDWGSFGIFSLFSMVLFWVLLILGVVALFRYLGKPSQTTTDKTPLDILKERYARGEINKKEFEEMKKDLM